MLEKEIEKAISKVPKAIFLNYAFYKGMESRNNFRYKSIIETSLYVDLIQSDLVLAIGCLMNSKTELEQKFYARILSMNLYEYLKDLSSILGKELVDNLKNIEFEEPIEDLNKLNKEFSNYRKNNSEKLKHIRHKSTAHKSKNRIELIETIFNIDANAIGDLTTEVILLNNKLINIFSRIIKFISDYHKKNGQLEKK